MNRSFFTLLVLTLALNASGFAARAQPTYTLTQIQSQRTDVFAIEIADLNDKGEVVGQIFTDSGRLGFLWRDGEMTLIPRLSTEAGSLTLPTAINNRSDIVGFVEPPSGPFSMFRRGRDADAVIAHAHDSPMSSAIRPHRGSGIR